MIALSPNKVGSSTITLNSSLTISGEVTLVGPSCSNSGPAFNVVGGPSNATDGITLMGGGLYGVKVSGFGGRQLVAKAGNDYVGCVKASKS